MGKRFINEKRKLKLINTHLFHCLKTFLKSPLNLWLFYLINKGHQIKLMNIPAQMIIGSFIYNKLLEKEQDQFRFYKRYNNFNISEWFGDNYFYDEDDLKDFWGVKNLKDINGCVYIREFDNLTRDEEKFWRSLSLNGYQIKIYWCWYLKLKLGFHLL